MRELRKLLSLLLLVPTLINNVHAQKKKVAYLCVYMDGKSEDLRYCASTDGYHFTSVNNGDCILKSTLGGNILRDPQIILDQRGTYHLITTNGWKGRSFAIWDSQDLINWKNERLITASLEQADKTWAPEAIYDTINDDYVFYWTSSINQARGSWAIYYSTTKDFENFSTASILMNSDNIILDADIVKYQPDKFFMFYRYKNQIWKKTATSVTGHYGDSTLVVDANVEGPYVYQVGQGKWNMIWDYYGGNQGRYGMAESTDLVHWKWLTTKSFPYYNDTVSFPQGVRHGAVIQIATSQLKQIHDYYNNKNKGK
ncbi:MAG TPA: glycoside hydrolase family 43 protein [Mucilaginibacter sp.]|jgi:sucrose-6-phosphate hydrolase SacC (GH32 family)